MKKTSKGKQISLFAAFWIMVLSSVSAMAQPDNDDENKTLSPYFVVISDSETDNLPLKETSVKANIVGTIADVTVKQVYVNSGKNTLEAIYTFPLSTKAAVYGMKMTIGNRIIHAQIEEKQKAREDYEKAKSQGKRASLLEQSRPNVFTMNVSNIVPNDIIVVELNYTELLVPENGQYTFVYPTVVGPRYSNKKKSDAAADDEFVATPYTKSGVMPTYKYGYELAINSGIPIQDVTCNTHKMNISHPTPRRALVQLKPSETKGGNRDVIVKYSLKGNQIQSGMMLYEGKNENFFLMMVQPPKQVLKENIPPREYIFIVDVSGSMRGFPLDITKKLMRNLIVNLKPTDKFNVVLFSGAAAVMNPTSIDATQANIDRAVKFIDEKKGMGGTEVLGALKLAFSIPRPSNDFSRTFVIATDGYVDVERDAFELIRKNSGETNFFSFGIGSGVNRYMIEGMAFAGNGEPMIVTKESEAAAQAEKFRKYINTPVLTRIKFNPGSFQTYEVEPPTVPDMLAERPITIFGKYKGKPAGTVTLTGKEGKKTYKQTFDLSKIASDKNNSALRYLWARERIKYLDYLVGQYNRNDNDPTIKEITDLGLKYNLMTNYTSFIAIDEKIVKQNGKNVTVKQPVPMPEGVSDYAVGNVASVQMARKPASLILAEEDGGVEESAFQVVEIMPEYPGGMQECMKFIAENIHYPISAQENGIQGRVIVKFTINKDGSISDVEIVRSIDPALDAEAIRVIKSMPKWKPGMQCGKAVRVKYTLPVTFRLKEPMENAK